MKISIDSNKVSSSLELKNIIKKSIITSAVILNLSPLLFKNYLNNNAKLALASAGFIFSICSLKTPGTEYEEKLLKTYKDSSIKEHKLILTGEISKINTELEIKNQIELANLIENLPDYQIPFFASKYGVNPILANNYIKNNSDNSNIISDEKTTLNINESLFDKVLKRSKIESNSDLNWIKKAIDSSCFIAGKKRSGKTYFMKFLLHSFIEKSNDKDIFYISDPHYDSDDYWISESIDKKLISNGRLVKSQSDTLNMIHDIINCGIDRKNQGLTIKKNVGKIRLFLDEIDSYDSESQEFISNAIKKIEYEFAKYNISCVIGCHTMKKSINGIDSSVTSSMLNILFPSIVLDRNNILSSALPSIPKLKNMMEYYKNHELPIDGRMVIVLDDSESYISHIPNLNLADINISKDDNISDDNNPIDKIKKWCYLCYEKFQVYPSRELLKKAWFDETNQDLSDSALDFLIEKIGIKY